MLSDILSRPGFHFYIIPLSVPFSSDYMFEHCDEYLWLSGSMYYFKVYPEIQNTDDYIHAAVNAG